MPEKWIIATNGTKYASEAVKYAASLCKEMKSKPDVHMLVVAIEESAISEAKAILEMSKYTFEDTAGIDIPLDTHLETGEPGKVIVDTVKKLKADHLFIGGADFKWDMQKEGPGGVSNFIINNLSGRITLIK